MWTRRFLTPALLLVCTHVAGASGNPVDAIHFLPQVRFIRFPATPYTSEDTAFQRITDPEHFRMGAVLIRFHPRADWSTIVSAVILAHAAEGATVVLERNKDFAARIVERDPPTLLVLPFRGWAYDGEYVLRLRETARYRDGRPLLEVDVPAGWVIKVPGAPLPFQEASVAPGTPGSTACRSLPTGRPCVLKHDKTGEPVQVLDEPLNRPVQFEDGPYGRITERAGLPFSYTATGSRIEDDHHTYLWDWRGRLYVVNVKNQWPDGEGGTITPPFAGHQIRFEYDALGRLLWRKHLDPDGGLVEKRVFVWEQQGLVAEAAFADESETALRWRKTYLPGPQRLDDQVQMRVETFPSTGIEEPCDLVYTFLRDELGTVIAVIEEIPGADPDAFPQPAAKYLYSPYGDLIAVGGRTVTATKELFPGGQNLQFEGFWTDPVTGLAYARARWYDPRTTHFLSEDPAGSTDSENLYVFVAGRPHARTDPLGLTARTDIKNNRLFYTWHLGWIDLTHAQRNYPSLEAAWQQLQGAKAGETVSFSLLMKQGEEGSVTFKQTTIDFEVAVAETSVGRKNQLLYAWQILSEKFEEFQGKGIQSSQFATSLWGAWKGEEQKVASSFSTEDLVSDLVMFYTVVEGETREALLDRYAGRLSREDEKKFSYLVWDYFLKPQLEGNREWKPVFVDLEQMMNPNPLGNAVGEWTEVRDVLKTAPEMAAKYLEKLGKPQMPAYFQQYVPSASGVTVHEPVNTGGVVENLKQKMQ